MSELRVYGQSDDNIYIEGPNFDDQFSGGDDPTRVSLGDGSILDVKYGKVMPDGSIDYGIWEVKVLKAGSAFLRIEPCLNRDAKIYSDIAYFKGDVSSACVHVSVNGSERVIKCPECYHDFEIGECPSCGALVAK
jgi:hypothetical protein